MSIKIDKSVMSTKKTSQRTGAIKWIFLHYTAGTSSSSGVAKNVARYFANSVVNASADFIIDDKNIVQYNADIRNRFTWAVGDAKYPIMTTSEGGKYYTKAFNENSISIEMCSRKKSTKTLKATDTDWYFTDAVLDLTHDLVRYLMDLYQIDADHVIMHHHRTGKICPNPWCVNESRLKKYHTFINGLTKGLATTTKKCNVYKGMNDWEGKYTSLNKGTSIQTLKDIGNGWSKVTYEGNIGYVKNSALKRKDKTALSTYPERKATQTVVLRSAREVSKATKIESIPAGTTFILLAKDDKWARIKYEGEKYYVWKAKTNVK